MTIGMNHPNPREPVRPNERGPEPEVVQLTDRPGREHVAAGFRPRKDAAFDDDDVMAAGGEPRSGSSTGWAAADDQDISGGAGRGAGRSDDQGSASGA
jgi:hypothetical protein